MECVWIRWKCYSFLVSCLCRERVFRTGVLVCKGCSEAPRLPAAPPVEQQCQLLAAAPGRPAGVLGQASSLGGHPADGLGTHQWLLPLVISLCLRTKIISPCGQVSPCWLLSLGRFALLLFQHICSGCSQAPFLQQSLLWALEGLWKVFCAFWDDFFHQLMAAAFCQLQI